VITLPTDIEKGSDWNSRTGLDKHLESSMDFEEHQRIAFDALKLLAGDLAVADNIAGERLKQLKKAYEGGNPGDVLYISKGIHQPETNPHMQLRLKRDNSWYTFHLNVSVSDVDIPGLPQKYFHWVGVQFSAEASTTIHGTVSACWPMVAARDTKWRHPRRKMSIAPKDVQGTIEAIARATREAQEKANRIEQARSAESTKAKTRDAIAKQLNSNNWTIPGNKNNGMNKLIAGETIGVTTKTGKTIKVKYEGGMVKQSFT
jgi:hypothetical protein